MEFFCRFFNANYVRLYNDGGYVNHSRFCYRFGSVPDTMRITFGTMTVTMGASPTTTSTIGLVPLNMRITLGATTATSVTSTTTPSTVGSFPLSKNANNIRNYSSSSGSSNFNLFFNRFISVSRYNANMARSFIGYYGFVGYNYFYYKFDSVMRITLGSIAETSVLSPSVVTAIDLIPFNANNARYYDGIYGYVTSYYFYNRYGSVYVNNTRSYNGNLGHINNNSFCFSFISVSYPSLNYLWKTNKECLKQYILPNLS